MVPLLIEVVVQVVEEVPPGVVVRIHDAEKQHEHGISQSTPQDELHDLLYCFIEHDDCSHGQQPDLEGGRRGVEVHIFVRTRSNLVGTCIIGNCTSEYIYSNVGKDARTKKERKELVFV